MGSTRRAETGCLPACRGRHYCASPYVCRLVVLVPDVLTGGPPLASLLLYVKRRLLTCAISSMSIMHVLSSIVL
jgi:hypothetical protein